jgi:CheY-like chemotaxis protein
MMGRRVLVVDDEPLVLEVLASMLDELGCETVRVQSAREALGTIAEDQTIDV